MHGLPMTRKLPITWLSVQGERIRVKEDLKCLGITLNGPLKFDAHFNCLTPKVEGAALLGRLLSNIGGPSNKMRHLYTEMIKFMTLYGSPISARHITKEGLKILRIQRRVAIPRAYCTVSHDVALILAGMTPFRNIAEAYTETYDRIQELRSTGVKIPRTMAAHMRSWALKRGPR